MDRRLGQQGHAHLSVTDVEVQRAGMPPAEGLMGVEELLHVPAFGKLTGQGIYRVAVRGGEE
jgi:hypothetical protein